MIKLIIEDMFRRVLLQMAMLIFCYFVQIVWKSVREVGMATAIGEKYGLIAVARYSPWPYTPDPSMPNDYLKNVNPPGT